MTLSAEHFVGRYSILLDDLWLSWFPPAWRKKRGYYFKATSRKKGHEKATAEALDPWLHQ